MRAIVPIALALLVGCQQKIQHGLDEQQANEIQTLLQEAGIDAHKNAEGGRDAKWSVAVPADSAAAAVKLLSDHDLPRRAPEGFGEVFGKGSVVPTAVEEGALYVHALSGEIERTLGTLEGVVHARVHLVVGVANQATAFRPPVKPRASVLLKIRAGKSEALLARREELQALVAGSVENLDPSAVAVMVSEMAPARPLAAPAQPDLRPLLAAAAGLIALLAIALTFAALHARKLRLRNVRPIVPSAAADANSARRAA